MPSATHVMLAIHVKRTDNVELKNPILSYIRETYSDHEAEDAVDDLAAIQTLRNELVTSQAGSQLTAKDSYTKCAPCSTVSPASVLALMHARSPGPAVHQHCFIPLVSAPNASGRLKKCSAAAAIA